MGAGLFWKESGAADISIPRRSAWGRGGLVAPCIGELVLRLMDRTAGQGIGNRAGFPRCCGAYLTRKREVAGGDFAAQWRRSW